MFGFFWCFGFVLRFLLIFYGFHRLSWWINETAFSNQMCYKTNNHFLTLI